jgi:hypothetical protein
MCCFFFCKFWFNIATHCMSVSYVLDYREANILLFQCVISVLKSILILMFKMYIIFIMECEL